MPAAIVTGSGRGIGKATALLLAKKGFDVVVTARTEKEILETKKEVDDIGRRAIAVKADVSSSKDVERLVKETVKNFGRIDVLVNNAGILIQKKLHEMSEKEWDDTIDINLKGVFLCSKAVIPYMIKQRGGTIVNISSGAGKTGFANIAAYCASKFGVIGLTESMAKELAKYNITVVAICPGPVATKMQEQFAGPSYKLVKHFMQQPEDVAEFVWKAVQGKYSSGEAVDTY
jgi:3-oxoacyl-[acyl-carrier protein] reductase